jgi:hypothetical protein
MPLDHGCRLHQYHRVDDLRPNPVEPLPQPVSLPLTPANRLIVCSMRDVCGLIWCVVIGLFRPRAALEAEILVLRHQLNILRRRSPKRVTLSSIDRLLLVGLYRLAPGTLDALKIIRPATLLRWHRAGFRASVVGRRCQRTFAV